MNTPLKIGVFDSGLGGLSVLRALHAILPHSSFVYFADTAHAPYGEKSLEELLSYTQYALTLLTNLGCNLIVIACHTASTTALPHLCVTPYAPIIDMKQASIEGLQGKDPKHLAIMGTTRTIASKHYENTLQALYPQALLYPLACPLLVPLIEEGNAATHHAGVVVQHYLKNLPTGTLIFLACTHYPLLAPHFSTQPYTFFDPAPFVAKQVQEYTARFPLSDNPPCVEFLVSAHPQLFQQKGSTFSPIPIEKINLIPPYERD